MVKLQNLYLEEQTTYIESIISKHITAKVVIVASRNDIGNRISISRWGNPGAVPSIVFPRTISTNEQLSALLQMMSEGRSYGIPRLHSLAEKLLASESSHFLKYLVLHEIAHIKNRWPQKKEIACHLWALENF